MGVWETKKYIVRIHIKILMKNGNRINAKNAIKYRISKSELLSPRSLKQINLQFLMNAKKGIKNSDGDVTQYILHDMSHSKMKKYILALPKNDIIKINLNFPEKSDIFNQCAYYFRAFSRGQIFLDANHRTAYFSLKAILKKKGIEINADNAEITAMTEYVKGQGWIKLPIMDVNLKEKDEVYRFLVDWFQEKLKLR